MKKFKTYISYVIQKGDQRFILINYRLFNPYPALFSHDTLLYLVYEDFSRHHIIINELPNAATLV